MKTLTTSRLSDATAYEAHTAHSGVVASLEYRAPLRDLFGRSAATGTPRWYGAVFVDAGYGWNVDLPDPELDTLVSAGLSLSWRPTDRFTAQVYAAAQLEELDDPQDEQLQDFGVGFRSTAKLW